ncbi:hypothetical protein ACQ4PT_061466 [Festuca glaucescens]
MAASQEKPQQTFGVLRNAAALLDEMQLMGEAQGAKKVINSELWHACAGPLVCLPQRGSLVYYFPQGHSEQVAATTRKIPNSRIPNYPNLPSQLLCQVHSITMHADKDTDEVYAQMTLQPMNSVTHRLLFWNTQDYSMQPPNQELIVRDLHDNMWTFRHIYRGQPKRHLLTTGWSLFVGAKRLKAGDSVLFIRDEKSQLLVGVRRATRQQTALSSSVLSTDSMHIGVLAAAAHAASSGGSFTIYYNPRTSPSPFVVPVARYNKANYIQQSVGMRMAMMFETEESSKRRYTGTIVGVSDSDPMRWPNSKWRNLQIEWDEHGYGERPDRVSIWDIETPENTLVFPSAALNSKRQCLPGYGVPGLELGAANMSSFQRAPGIPYGNLQHMPAIGSELAIMMLLNQSGQNLGTPVSYHQSSYSSIIQNVKQSYMPPSTFGNSTGSTKHESMPSNEAQQQLNTPKMQRGDLESCEVLPVIDPISSSELNVAARKTRNTEIYSSQSISEQHGKGEPRAKTRKSKKGSSRKAISENSELSSAPSRVCDGQQHGLEGKLLDGDTAHVNRGSNEDSFGTLTHGNLSVEMQGQLVEENGLLSPPKLGSSISPDGGKSVNSFPNQGCFSQFFDGLDWMIQPSYYQEPSGIQSVSASENIFSSSADIPSTINTDTLETFQNSCLSDSFPNSIQDFIGSPDLNSLTFLSPDMQNFDVHHNGSNLPSTSNSYVQMSFSEDSGTQMESIQRSMNNTSCSQPQATDGFDLGMYSRLPSLKESQVLSLPEIHNSSRGTSVCSMDATTEYSIKRSAKPMKPPVRTYTKVQKLGSVGRSIDVTRYRDYRELRSAIASMFGLQGKLEHPASSDWKLVYVDYENDVLLVGDDPWEQSRFKVSSLLFGSAIIIEAQQPRPKLRLSSQKRKTKSKPPTAATDHRDAKIGTETPKAAAAAAGDGDAAARKRPGAEDAPAAGDGKRRRAENPSSGSRDRHHQQHHRQKPGDVGGKEGKKERMRASHILIKHEGSRRKASWRDPEGVAISATTRDDAADLARALRDQIVAGELKFEAAATDNSDCNSAKRGGDLGPFERGKMQKPFEKAVIALKVGEMSDVVDTDSGVHIILRTG